MGNACEGNLELVVEGRARPASRLHQGAPFMWQHMGQYLTPLSVGVLAAALMTRRRPRYNGITRRLAPT